MTKVALKATHQALFDVAKGEYKYLTESKAHDGFDLSELETLGSTDEELHIAFTLKASGMFLHFKYSLGYDFDEDDGGYYRPYVEVECCKESEPQDPIAFKRFANDQMVVGEVELLEAIEQLGRTCGESRFEAFQWLEQKIRKPANMERAST